MIIFSFKSEEKRGVKEIRMSRKLVAFFFVVGGGGGVIDVAAIYQGLDHTFEKFAFEIANKDLSGYLYWGVLPKGNSCVLANCSLCGSEATYPFWQAQFVSVFSSEICTILQDFRWSQQHQQLCHFSFSSSSQTLALSLPLRPLLHLSFYLKLSAISGRNCFLSYFTVRLHWVPGPSFFVRNDA